MMNQLLKQFFIYGLGSTIGKFLSVFLLPIYTSVLSPEDYGNLDFIITISTIISVFGLLQIETGLQRFYYDYSDKTRSELVQSAFVFTLIATFVIFAIACLFLSPMCDKYLGGLYKTEMVISFFGIIPMNLLTIIFVDFRFENKSLIYSILTVLMVIGNSVLAIISVIVLDAGILGIIASNTVTYAIICAIAFGIWIRNNKCRRVNLSMIKEMLSFGLPQFPARLGSISNTYINRFFIFGMLSTYAIGIYSISLKVASVMQLVLMAFQLAWLPFMYKLLKEPDHKTRIVRIFQAVTIIVSFIVIIIALFSKEIILLLTNKEYIESAKYTSLLAYFYGLYLLKEIVDIGVNVTKKPKYTTYIFAVSSILNIILLYVLTPLWGLYGVVIALLASNIILFYLTALVSEKLYPMNFPIKWSLAVTIIVIVCLFILSILDIQLSIRIIVASLAIVMALFYFRSSLRIISLEIKKNKFDLLH